MEEARLILVKERDMAIKKEREREEEQYQYDVKLKRQREKEEFLKELNDMRKEFEEEKKRIEEELKAKESALDLKFQEFENLKKQVDSFPQILEKEIKIAEQKTKQAAEEKMRVEKLILEKDMEKEREIYKLTLNTLQDKVKEQEARIKSLEKNLKEIISQTQAVASKAIEGIARIKVYGQLIDTKSEVLSSEKK